MAELTESLLKKWKSRDNYEARQSVTYTEWQQLCDLAMRGIAPSAIERREPTLEILTAMAVELGMMPAGDPLIVQWIPTLKRQYLAALKVSERASPQVSVPARIGDSLEQRAPDSRQAISTPTSDAPLTPPPEEAPHPDTKRLDFLNDRPLAVGYAHGYRGSKSTWTWTENHTVRDAPSLRDAIDAAMSHGMNSPLQGERDA